VDITIIQRGDNLQININSNNQAINFFHTHQIELKNALVNMGYSGIDMSFNSNQNKENQQKKAYKQYSLNTNDENYDELIIEIPYTYA
jgi:flagellar hook-length control protein FliK